MTARGARLYGSARGEASGHRSRAGKQSILIGETS
jgi:hypothetical protein